MHRNEVHSPPSTSKGKRRKVHDIEEYAVLSDSPTDSDDEKVASEGEGQKLKGADASSTGNSIKVVRLAWLQDSMSRGRLLDHRQYLIYEASKTMNKTEIPTPDDLLRRAKDVAAGSSQSADIRTVPYRRQRDGGHHVKAPALVPHSTTDEHVIASLPPIPASLQTPYACQRSTLVHPPNEAFIQKLKEVRELRAMKGDGVGVRAYSTAIASLSAYPYKLQSPIGQWTQTTGSSLAVLTFFS